MIIFLIGFMGSGKSYTGKNLAPLLDYDYIDMDKYLEEKEGCLVKDIFEKRGETFFRQLEKDFLNSLQPEQNLVVSTGGGAPCFFNNMDIMNTKGLTIYLNRSKDFIIQHLLKGIHRRPLLSGMNKQQVEDFYEERLKARKPFYEKAKLHVGDADTEEIFRMIENADL